jgi:tetratricopeptide (TPR) repeat protein
MAPARDRLRRAIAQLRKSQAEVDELARSLNRVGATQKPDEPTADEVAALKRHVDYQLARAYRNQGESYPAGSPDRTSALAEATKGLELLARSEPADDVAWQARLDEGVCRRLVGDLDGAERMLDLIDKQSPPADVAEQARAERIRIRLDAARLDEAQKWIRDADVEPGASPEIQLAVLEWLIASSQAATKGGRAADGAGRQERAAALTKIIADRHSPHWGRRAESLLASAAAEAPTGDVGLLVKAAESFYQQGNVDRALEIYQRAYEKARELKDDGAAMQIAFAAAAVENAGGRLEAAASRLLAAAAAFPKHPQAAKAHLSAAFFVAQLAARENSAERLARYAKLLDEHVAQWPADESTRQAYLWIALLRSSQRDWQTAIGAIANIPASAPEAGAALDVLVPCWEHVLTEQQLAGRPLPILEMERSLGPFAPVLLGTLEDPKSTVVRKAAGSAARFWLRFANDRYPQASSVLTQLAGTVGDPAEQASAQAWLVLAEVGLQRYDAALARAQKIAANLQPADEVILDRLDELTRGRSAEFQKQIAAVTLRLLERTQAGRGSHSKIEARALVLVGRAAEARKLWDQLAAAAPNDVDLQEEFAEFLLAQPDRQSAGLAAAKWRIVERSAKESTPRWYRARLGLAHAYFQAGDVARAKQVVDLTTALHPDLGGDEMKGRFAALSAKLN